jgi:hypothetical protein
MTTEIASTKDGITPVEVRRPGVVTAEDLMPVLDLATAVRRRNFMVEVTRTLMVAGVDYGVIPGTGSKPTLLKPGAERLCTLFGLSPEVHELMVIEDWSGEDHRGEPFFYYRYKVRLVKNAILMGEAVGSCNSWEAKYRYRAGDRKCPKCGKPAIIRSKEEYGGGWVCFTKKGGCKAKFQDGDSAIEGQSTGRVPNPDMADQVNTIQKMAYKRALVAAVLIATNASEFYTQDVEDMETIDVPSAEPPREAKTRPAETTAATRGTDCNTVTARDADPPSAKQAKPPQANQEAPARPWNNFTGMVNEFAKLRGQLGPDHDHIYGEVLREFGVEHSNQFPDYATATAAFRKLRSRVREIKAANQQDAEIATDDYGATT